MDPLGHCTPGQSIAPFIAAVCPAALVVSVGSQSCDPKITETRLFCLGNDVRFCRSGAPGFVEAYPCQLSAFWDVGEVGDGRIGPSRPGKDGDSSGSARLRCRVDGDDGGDDGHDYTAPVGSFTKFASHSAPLVQRAETFDFIVITHADRSLAIHQRTCLAGVRLRRSPRC